MVKTSRADGPKMKNWTQILDNYALNGQNPNTEKEKKH